MKKWLFISGLFLLLWGCKKAPIDPRQVRVGTYIGNRHYKKKEPIYSGTTTIGIKSTEWDVLDTVLVDISPDSSLALILASGNGRYPYTYYFDPTFTSHSFHGGSAGTFWAIDVLFYPLDSLKESITFDQTFYGMYNSNSFAGKRK